MTPPTLVERVPETAVAVRYTGGPGSKKAVKALHPTIRWGKGQPGGLVFDFNVYQWRPFGPGDWFLRRRRGKVSVVTVLSDDQYQQEWRPTSA